MLWHYLTETSSRLNPNAFVQDFQEQTERQDRMGFRGRRVLGMIMLFSATIYSVNYFSRSFVFITCRGKQGQTGPSGSSGAAGPRGPKGLGGPRGYQGKSGIRGSVGPSGVDGALGSAESWAPAPYFCPSVVPPRD